MLGLIHALKSCLPPFPPYLSPSFPFGMQHVLSLSFLFPLNGNLNIDFWFHSNKHKLCIRKTKSPNSDYERQILTTCIIQSICGHNEQAKMSFFLER